MIKIHQYTSQDYNGLIKLLHSVYDSNIDQDCVEEQYLTDNKEILIAKNTENEEIIGCVFVEEQQDYVRPSKILYITYLAVDEKYRRMGIGRKLMEHVEKECKEKACSAIEFTSADYRTNAHEFYKTLGYSRKKTTHFIKEISVNR